jgi:tripartite-type tricarboxylate transporter receptor subunit TctC
LQLNDKKRRAGHGNAGPERENVMPATRRKFARIGRRDLIIGAGAVAAASMLPRRAFAAYPDKPVKLIVPFPAGGGGDALARTVSAKVSDILGQQFVIDNRAGAGGNIGTAAAARSDPDGYTLAYGTNGTHAINHTLYKNPGFDALADFEPISRLTEIALMLIVTPSMPVKTLPELMAYLKANPGKVNAATAGNGTSSHLAAQMFKTATNLDFVIVHYRGGGPAMTDLISGQVQFMIEVMPNAFPQVEGGKMRGIAVTTAKRWPQTPDIPTFAESGMPGFTVTAWDAMFAPRGTPKDVIATVNAAVRKALEDPQLKETLLKRGAQTAPSSPEELRAHVQSELKRWGDVVVASGAKVD